MSVPESAVTLLKSCETCRFFTTYGTSTKGFCKCQPVVSKYNGNLRSSRPVMVVPDFSARRICMRVYWREVVETCQKGA